MNSEPIYLEQLFQLKDLDQFKNNPFESMIKFVVDIKREVIAIGGEMHADAEKVLLNHGSSQEDLWGSNLYPWTSPYKIEYISLINIRAQQGNRGMEIQDKKIQDRVKSVLEKWIQLF